MQTQATYPRVQTVRPQPGKKLLVTFSTGEMRVYDCQHLLRDEAFRPLADEALFQQVRPDRHGYGVIWSETIDLAESELWINGKSAEQVAPREPPPAAAVRSVTHKLVPDSRSGAPADGGGR